VKSYKFEGDEIAPVAGDDLTLGEGLEALDYDPREIQWHVDNRGQRMPQGYA
jgi:hypothetical protein